MHIVLKKRTQGDPDFGLIYGGIALLAIIAARFLPVLSLAPSCVFKGFFGVPCPTCGATRSVAHLAHGDIAGSLFMNPLVTIVFGAALLYLSYSLVTTAFALPRIAFDFSGKEKNAIRIGAAVIAGGNWMYLVLA